MWPCIRFEVKDSCIGTAYGITYSLCNAENALVLYIYGIIVDDTSK